MNLSQVYVAAWLSVAIGITGLVLLAILRRMAAIPWRELVEPDAPDPYTTGLLEREAW